MSFRVKSALFAALVTCSVTAAVASGASRADDMVPSVPSSDMTTDSPSSSLHSDAVTPRTIRFAPYKEVVQPLGPQARTVTAEEDSLSSTPRAEDMIAVPDRDFPSLAAMVRAVDTTEPLNTEANCLATAVFYESRSESLEGQLAVARVIINRSHSSRFANSLCSVVKEPRQFSFVRGGVLPKANEKRPAWKTAIAIARIAIENAWESRAEGALYFHARRVSPSWGRARVATIDNHIFYR